MLIEWLGSPIVYCANEAGDFKNVLRKTQKCVLEYKASLITVKKTRSGVKAASRSLKIYSR